MIISYVWVLETNTGATVRTFDVFPRINTSPMHSSESAIFAL